MATGPNYSRISVNDSGFYIVDSDSATLSNGVSFDAGVTGLRKITLPDKSGTLAMLDDTGGGGNPKASDITAGDASVLITTTAGGVSLDTNSGTSLVLNHAGIPQISLGPKTMTLESDSYTITHAGGNDNEDLTIHQVGGVAASLVLKSDGTGPDAVFLHAGDFTGGISMQSGTGGFILDTTGPFSIDSSYSGGAANITHAGSAGNDLSIGSTSGSLVLTGGEAAIDAVDIRSTNAAGGVSIRSGTLGTSIISSGNVMLESSGLGDNAITLNASEGSVNIVAKSGDNPVILQENTRYYGISLRHSTTDFETLITIDDLYDSGVSSAHFINVTFTAIKDTYAAGYVMDDVALYDKTTFISQGSSQAVAYGKFDSLGLPLSNTQVVFNSSEIVIRYKSNLGSGTDVKGLVKVTSASF